MTTARPVEPSVPEHRIGVGVEVLSQYGMTLNPREEKVEDEDQKSREIAVSTAWSVRVHMDYCDPRRWSKTPGRSCRG